MHKRLLQVELILQPAKVASAYCMFFGTSLTAACIHCTVVLTRRKIDQIIFCHINILVASIPNQILFTYLKNIYFVVLPKQNWTFWALFVEFAFL